jgi:DnaJ-domain-containing protein 1
MKSSLPTNLRVVLTNSRQGLCTRAGRVLSANSTAIHTNNNNTNHNYEFSHSGSRRQIHIISQPFTSHGLKYKHAPSIHDGRCIFLKKTSVLNHTLSASTTRTISVRSFSSDSKRDLYEVLGVPRSSNKAEVKKAYFKLAKKFHPDTNKVGFSILDCCGQFRNIPDSDVLCFTPCKLPIDDHRF